VLVSSKGGDGTDSHLPTPAAFDHVVVRATIDGKSYWLDGTRLGDRRLGSLPPPVFRWGLPLRSGAVALEAVPPQPPLTPLLSEITDIDARAGFDSPAHVSVEDIIRGDAAVASQRQLSGLAHADVDRALDGYWRQRGWNDVDAMKVSWRFDDNGATLVLKAAFDEKQAWDGDDQEGRSLEVRHGGFYPPDQHKRPAEQDQTAPWLTDFPAYTRSTTIIRLPPPTSRWRWDFSEAPMHRQLGGVSYWREAALRDGVFRSTKSERTVAPEITAAEARAANDPDPKFDNLISHVLQVRRVDGHEVSAPITNAQAQRLVTTAAEAVKAGHAADALAALDQAVALEPESATILKRRGEALSRLGRHEAALADFDAAWQIDPLDAAAVAAKTQELRTLGRSDDATALDTGDQPGSEPPAGAAVKTPAR
jgi:hypothetical protein